MCIKHKEYNVSIEIYGKRIKATVLAESEEEAKRIVLNRVNLTKVELCQKSEFNAFLGVLNKIELDEDEC